MNMISCDEPCAHQQEGCCTLEGSNCFTGSLHNGCPYFVPKSNPLPKEKEVTEWP